MHFFSEFEADADSGLQDWEKHEKRESAKDLESKHAALDVNSVVQINLDKGNPVTGIIRWIGCIPQTQQKMAGVELVSVCVVLICMVSVCILRFM